MSAPRIAMLTTSYPLEPSSSSGIFVARLAASLAADTEVTVVTPAYRGNAQPRRNAQCLLAPYRYAPKRWERLAHEPGGIPVALRNHPWLHLVLPPFLLSMGLAFHRHARGAHVLHANWAICGLVAGLVGRAMARPVVTTLRGEDVTRALNSPLDRWILVTAMARSDRVVTVSTAMAGQLARRFPRHAAKLVTIPNGVDERFLSASRRRTPRRAGTPLRLATVGSLIPRKGVDQLLRALARLPRKLEVSLEIIGKGPERQPLERLARTLGLAEQVHFLGALPPETIAKQLSRMDALVLASHSEGRPNVVLEAMAAGMPVVATAIDGVIELIEDGTNGLLFADGDDAELAIQLQRLAEETALGERLGRNAHQHIVDSGLVWEETGRRYLELYRSLAGEGH